MHKFINQKSEENIFLLAALTIDETHKLLRTFIYFVHLLLLDSIVVTV